MIMSHYFYDLRHLRCKGRNREMFSSIFWFKWKLQNLLSKLTDLYRQLSNNVWYAKLLSISVALFWVVDTTVIIPYYRAGGRFENLGEASISTMYFDGTDFVPNSDKFWWGRGCNCPSPLPTPCLSFSVGPL